MNEKIYFTDCFLALIALGIPFTIKFGNVALIIVFLCSFFFLIKTKRPIFQERASFELLFPIILFLIVLVSALFSDDLISGLKQVEKNILFPILAFTLVVMNSIHRINKSFILKIFSLSTLISLLILTIVALIRIYNGEGIEVFFFHELGRFFDLHPVYIAINLAITIFFITDEYLEKKKLRGKKLLICILILKLLVLLLFLCASKAVILFFILLYSAQLLWVFKGLKFRIGFFVAFLMLVSALAMTPKLSDRFKQGLEFNISEFAPTNSTEEAKVFTNDEKEQISDLELRYLMFKIGFFHVIDDKRLLFGYGIGDVQHQTDYYYMLYGLAPNWFEGYNLHNQYLQYLVTYGLIVLFFFCLYIAYSIYLAFKNKDKLHLLFLILISFAFLFECLLSRNKGIVIFIFFNTLFLIHHKNENSDSGHKGNTE